MFKKKKLILLIVIIFLICILTSLNWIRQCININNTFERYNHFISSDLSQLSFRMYLSIYTLFSILMYISISNRKIYEIIRFRSRKKYFLSKIVSNIFISAMITSAIISTCTLIFAFILFEVKELITLNFFEELYLMFINDILLFLIIICIYNLFNIILDNQVMSTIIILIFTAINYYIDKYEIISFSLGIFTSSMSAFFQNDSTYVSLIHNAYMIIIVITLLFLQMEVFSQKDII